MKKVIVLIGALMLLCSCDYTPAQKPKLYEYESDVTDEEYSFNELEMKEVCSRIHHVKYEGHKYLFYVYGRHCAFAHDPECECYEY